jgi:carbon monoxide dehydrogenase subunit G
MASIIRQFTLAAPAADVWDAIADFGALHTRLVPGFVTGTTVDGDVRTVTFGNGMVVRERLVGMDPERRRMAYTNALEGVEHHAASVTVEDVDGGSRATWITDVLPDAFEEPIGEMMDAGAAAMQRQFSSVTSNA